MAIDPLIRLLGPVSIGRGDAVRSAGGPRQAAVLAVLALQTGRPVGVERLIDSVWGDVFPDSVGNVIQVYVSALRKLVRPVGLTITRSGPTYTLDASLSDIDVEMFRRLAAEGRAALRSGDAGGALDLLDDARLLWRAEPFAGLDGCPFAAGATAALHAVALAAATDRGTALCALDRAAEAVVGGEELVAVNPFHEPAWALLMRALYSSGRQRDALHAYARARDLLLDEAGLDPSPELVELERRILEHSLEPVAGSGTVPAPPEPDTAPASTARQPPQPPSVVLGREDEIARTAALLDGPARLVTLVGLGGIGKTTAALVALQRLADQGHRTAFADISAATTPEQAMREVCVSLGLASSGGPIAALIAADPEVIVLADNAEQVDRFGPVVAELVRSTSHLRLLITSRTALDIRAEHLMPLHPLRLESGGASDAAALFVMHARRVRPDLRIDASDEAVVGICELAGGIPLAIEIAAGRLRRLTAPALLDRLRQRRGLLLDQTGGADLPDRQHSLRVVLDATASLLDADPVTVARQLSIVRGPVTTDLLVLALAERLSTDAVLDALEELAALGLLTTADDERCQLHMPVGEYFLEGHPTPAADLRAAAGAVLAVAEPLTEAIDAGGHWAESRLLDDVATIAAACQSVLAEADGTGAARLAHCLRRYWLLASRLDEARNFCTTARTFATRRDDIAVLDLVGAQFAAILGRSDAGALLTAALESATSATVAPLLVVNTRCYLGSWYCDHGEEEHARATAARVLDDASATGDREILELARDFSAYVANRLGDMETAGRLNRDALADARQRGDRYVVISLLNRQSEIDLTMGQLDAAKAEIDEALELATTMSIGPLGVKMLALHAAVELELGNISAAIGASRAALRTSVERYPDPLTQAAVLRILAAAWHSAGGGRTATQADEAGAVILRRAGVPADTTTLLTIDRRLASLRADPGFDAVRDRVALELDDVVAGLLS